MRTFCILGALLSALGTAAAVCPISPTASAPNSYDLPRCGDGVLQDGEVCDDGNRVSGDGCNAWCSSFDAMTGGCTMAGRNSACPTGVPVQGSPADTIFCGLTAIAANGTSLIVADMGRYQATLFHYDLLVNVLQPISTEIAFGRVCSIDVQ